MSELQGLVARVAAALRSTGITPDGPVDVPPAVVPAEFAARVPHALQAVWAGGASRIRWRDHDEQRLGRDARHGGLWVMGPGEAQSEVRQYVALVEDERGYAEPQHLDLAEATWGTWTPFHGFPSGDLLAVEPAGEVVLWQHDLLDGGPYCHGLRLGVSLNTFLDAWARVAFAEPRDWREVATTDEPGLNLDGADWRLLL